MKKIVLYTIAILLLLCGCKNQPVEPVDPTDSQTPTETATVTQPSDSTAPTTPENSTEPAIPTETVKPTETAKPTETGKPTETIKPTETTAPTEAPAKPLAITDWQLEPPKYLSYEDYFAIEREFANTTSFHSQTAWIKGSKVYAFGYENGLLYKEKNDERLAVYCEETGEKYIVPGSAAYISYTIAGADGHFGYLYNENRILRIDLATGSVENVLDGQNFYRYYSFSPINIYVVDNLVVYYVSYANSELTIGRLYLPTMKNEVLYSTQGEYYNISLQRPKTNQSPVVWTMMNPDFVSYLKAELADPNSKIQKGEYYDYSERWKDEDAFSSIIKSPMHLHHLQDAGNQRALLKCTLDIASGEVTKQTGIMDSCFHGSGYPHDHFNTDVTTAPAPEVIMGDWSKIDQEVPFALLPINDESTVNNRIVKVTDVDSKMYLYAKTDGDYKKISSVPISMAVDTGTCAIYLTADQKAVVAVNYDGTRSVELYRAAYGGVDYIRFGNVELKVDGVRSSDTEKRFVLRDGDTLIQIDLESQQCRELVKHPNLQGYQFDCGFGDVVYFEVYVGMYVSGYTLDLETGELRERGYFL